MLISDSDEFIFIHNPKCAGTTVRSSLMKYDTRVNQYWGFDELYKNKVDKAHLPYNLARLLYPTLDQDMQRYTVFGFVRSPLSRVISAFNESNNQLLIKANNSKEELEIYRLRLNRFLQSLNTNNTLGWDIKYRHCVQQHLMHINKGKMLTDVIIKVEDLIDTKSTTRLKFLKPNLSKEIDTWSNNKKNIKKIKFNPIELLDRKSLENVYSVYSQDYDVFSYDK